MLCMGLSAIFGGLILRFTAEIIIVDTEITLMSRIDLVSKNLLAN